jgi:hypothetical protein
MPRVGLVEDHPMTELGASPYTPNVGTAALFVPRYESSAAACILGTEAIKPPVLLERAAQST